MFDTQIAADAVQKALMNLAPEELQELDRLITPRAATLLLKAFGPGMAPILEPLVAKDDAEERRVMEQELRALMQDPRYWRDRDPKMLEEVSAGFRKLYPPQPGQI